MFQHENIEKVKDFEEEQIEHQIYNELVEKEKKKEINTAYEPKVSIIFLFLYPMELKIIFFYFKTFARKKVVWN